MAFRKGFYRGWLTDKALLQLRRQVSFGSLFIHDYENDFGISPEQVCNFFDGFESFIQELMKEDGVQPEDIDEWNKCFNTYDNDDNLLAWYGCFEENPFTEFEEAA